MLSRWQCLKSPGMNLWPCLQWNGLDNVIWCRETYPNCWPTIPRNKALDDTRYSELSLSGMLFIAFYSKLWMWCDPASSPCRLDFPAEWTVPWTVNWNTPIFLSEWEGKLKQKPKLWREHFANGKGFAAWSTDQKSRIGNSDRPLLSIGIRRLNGKAGVGGTPCWLHGKTGSFKVLYSGHRAFSQVPVDVWGCWACHIKGHQPDRQALDAQAHSLKINFKPPWSKFSLFFLKNKISTLLFVEFIFVVSRSPRISHFLKSWV